MQESKETDEKPITWHGKRFLAISRFWFNLRRFCFENDSLTEIIFSVVYALEQIGLIWSIFYVKTPEGRGFIISIYIVVILTTFALQKVAMQSRINVQEEKIQELNKYVYHMTLEAEKMQERHETVVNAYKNLKKTIDLNRINTFK